MKKIITVIVTLLLVFTLSSCSNEDIEIVIMVYSDNPAQAVIDLEELPELIANEMDSLGYAFDRIVLQSSNNIAVIEDGLVNGLINIALLDPSMVSSDKLVRVLSVVKEEVDHPDGDMNGTTYQKAIVTSSTERAESLKLYLDTTELYDFTVLNNQSVCSTSDDEDLITEFAYYMGMTASDQALLNLDHTISSTQEMYEGLENGTCDVGIVTLEETADYQDIWEDNLSTIYDDLSVIHTFESIHYEGLYANQDAEELLIMSLVQSFIQISSHSTNQELLDFLGHKSYYVTE